MPFLFRFSLTLLDFMGLLDGVCTGTSFKRTETQSLLPRKFEVWMKIWPGKVSTNERPTQPT